MVIRREGTAGGSDACGQRRLGRVATLQSQRVRLSANRGASVCQRPLLTAAGHPPVGVRTDGSPPAARGGGHSADACRPPQLATWASLLTKRLSSVPVTFGLNVLCGRRDSLYIVFTNIHGLRLPHANDTPTHVGYDNKDALE